MPLAEPPTSAGSLTGCPGQRLAGTTIYRVYRAVGVDGSERAEPWWFATVPVDPTDPASGGRFDLSAPMGTCYLAARPVGAVLEALQAHLVSLPIEELRPRRLARVIAPDHAPRAARLTSRALAGQHGVTAALWAGGDRLLTQRWAGAFRRDGWWALYGGLQHDPSGRLRGYALFDHADAHPPTVGGTWRYETSSLADDAQLHDDLASFGVTVRAAGELPFTKPT